MAAIGRPAAAAESLSAGREGPARAVAVQYARYRRRAMTSTDRVQERRTAAALARHYRDEEGLSIAEIARRLGRAPATVKAYLYDPSDANKRPTDSPRAHAASTLRAPYDRPCASAGCPAPPVGLGLMLDRVTERRRAAQLARHYRDQEGLAIAEIARRLGRAEATVKAYLYDPTGDKARAVKARYRGVCRGCGAPTAPGTARATPTRIANAAIPARSRRNGPGNGFAKQCAHGERATALRRRPTTGRAPTHAGAAAKRSNDYRPENGPRRPLSPICTGAGRRPAPTPSAAPERLGLDAVDTRTRACA